MIWVQGCYYVWEFRVTAKEALTEEESEAIANRLVELRIALAEQIELEFPKVTVTV